jgi:archaellum component FlaF (FlaF/FlaG flagellin family)
MSKIEEITEILVNEMDSFEKGLSKLEVLQQKISNTKIKLEFQEIQEAKNEMIRELVLSRNEQQEFLSGFEVQIKNASIYPKWAVIIFIISLLVSFGSLFYTYTVKQDIDATKKEAYRKGVDASEKYINQFFESYPKTKKTFEKWEEVSKKS